MQVPSKARCVKGCSQVPIEQGRMRWCHEKDADIVQLNVRGGSAYFSPGKQDMAPWRRFQWFLVALKL